VALEGREGGDRSLVVAASRLTRVVRDVDTVCRVTETRFAILVEGPQRSDQLKLLAQHIVAKGLEQGSILPGDVSLRFRLVSTLLPADATDAGDVEDGEERRILARLGRSLDELAIDSRKVVLHLPQSLAQR
jgi:two-component system, sensor histidine kinase LadS